jgi:hypothetical protein
MNSPYELPELPFHTPDLEQIAENLRPCYEPAPEGGYRLTPGAAAEQDRFEAECRRMDAERDRALAALQAKHQRLEARLAEGVVAEAVDRALARAGVPPDLLPAAAALVRRDLRVTAVPGPAGELEAVAEDALGRADVASAVGAWLNSDAGRPYRPQLRETGPGPLTLALRNLRETLH